MVLFLLAGLFGLLSPVAAMAAGGDITIHGEGLNSTEPITITQAQLRGEELLPDGTTLEQNDVWYSTINTWPTKKWYRGVGVKLTDLLSLAGGLRPEATMIKFSAPEGFSAVFTVQEFVYTPRYCFPNFMDTGLPGYLPGDTSESMQVETIIAHQSVSAQVYEEISDDENFSDGEANLLLFGQRAVTEQTNARFVKNLTQIEVLTDPVAKWDSPLAEPSPGEVPVGTMVRLSGPKNDEDKVHYTLDGSEPTIKSPMYNWIAWRWWDSRQDELDDINTPIEITKDTVIKAKVIGPGKEDSDIATFTYQVPLAAAPVLTADSTDNKIGKDIEITFIDNESWRNAIIEVVINNSTLDQDKYVLEAGKIIIYANAFADTGDYTILIKANGYQDAAVSQTITGGSSGGSGGDPKRPPTLNADTNGNFVEEYIRITFRDDRAWRESIDRIEVDGDSLSSKDYTIGEGYIEITDTVFSAPGTYWITIKATGYDDASIAQKIIDNKDAVLTITGEGVKETKTFTWEELEDMPQQQYVYSVINTWPSKRWYIGEGVKLDDLFAEAGGITRDATLIKFFSRDGYYMTLTVEELLEDTRYCFPNFQDGGVEGHIPGSSSGKKVVKPILALKSAESSDDPDDMNKADSLLLMMGQRAVTEQTGPLFV
ncbi:MAG: DUF1533 domain-containing protein, partial [Clostridia bacterium]|nr:DUF1533 domain-containing protein [Clostridia bacterium]